MRRTLVAIALVLAASGCCPLTAPARRCPDGWPVKWLLDPRCARGVCGWTCAPDRWRVELGEP